VSILAMHPILHNLQPELWLVCGASVILLIGSITRRSGWSFGLSVLTLGGAFWAAYELHRAPGPSDASLIADSLLWYTRAVTLAVGLLILLVNRHVPVENERAEFFSLILLALCGISTVAAANDLVLLFLALELVSVPTYILVGLSRRDIRAQEATGKYFFLGAFAAALTLYGFSFLYAATGTTQVFSGSADARSIAAAMELPSVSADRLTILGLLLAIGGLAFKLAAVPLHAYVADVYQGAASPITGLLGFVPKMAGFVAIIRLMSAAGWEHSDAMFWLLWAMAAATMTVGNTLALMQHNVKRMLAYSSVAHSGYMLVGLVAGPGDGESPLRSGLSAMLFYLPLYGVMNLGAFAALTYFRKQNAEGEDDSVELVEDLGGAGRIHPWPALALSICVFGLMGMPPTGGFLGKLYLFSAGLAVAPAGEQAWRHTAMIALVVLSALNAAVAMAYYLRIIASCYLGKPAEGIRPSTCRALGASLALCSITVVLLFARPGVLLAPSRVAASRLATARPVRTFQVDSAGRASPPHSPR